MGALKMDFATIETADYLGFRLRRCIEQLAELCWRVIGRKAGVGSQSGRLAIDPKGVYTLTLGLKGVQVLILNPIIEQSSRQSDAHLHM